MIIIAILLILIILITLILIFGGRSERKLEKERIKEQKQAAKQEAIMMKEKVKEEKREKNYTEILKNVSELEQNMPKTKNKSSVSEKPEKKRALTEIEKQALQKEQAASQQVDVKNETTAPKQEEEKKEEKKEKSEKTTDVGSKSIYEDYINDKDFALNGDFNYDLINGGKTIDHMRTEKDEVESIKKANEKIDKSDVQFFFDDFTEGAKTEEKTENHQGYLNEETDDNEAVQGKDKEAKGVKEAKEAKEAKEPKKPASKKRSTTSKTKKTSTTRTTTKKTTTTKKGVSKDKK